MAMAADAAPQAPSKHKKHKKEKKVSSRLFWVLLWRMAASAPSALTATRAGKEAQKRQKVKV